MESCRRLRELRISFQIQVNHQDDLTSQLLCSRHRGKNEFFFVDVHTGGGGSGQSGRLWTGGGGSKSLFFCGRHKWTTPNINDTTFYGTQNPPILNSQGRYVSNAAKILLTAGVDIKEVQEMVEHHLQDMILKHFDPKKADSIFTDEGEVRRRSSILFISDKLIMWPKPGLVISSVK